MDPETSHETTIDSGLSQYVTACFYPAYSTSVHSLRISVQDPDMASLVAERFAESGNVDVRL